jgi:multiple sugar transport system permease protein
MSATVVTAPAPERHPAGRHYRWRRWLLQAFLISMSLLWLFPIFYAILTSLRPYEETAVHGYASIPALSDLSLDNYVQAWNQADLAHFFWNTIVIVIPAVIIVLFLGSMMAFSVSRYSWRFNLALLMLFTALNLLPPQIVITPLFRMYLTIPVPEILPDIPTDNGLLYDQVIGMVLIHVAFQLGFVTFVLSNYMKTLPKELNEAAIVDGASVWKTFRSIILPLTRPALAALATLQVTWIYNDFFWGLMLMFKGSKFPVTSALNNLKGQFFVDNNLIAAGSLLVAIPTLIVFFALQRHFIAGLTLGSTKG